MSALAWPRKDEQRNRPIMMTGHSVRGIQTGLKRQTRRIVRAPRHHELDGHGKLDGEPVALSSRPAMPTGSKSSRCPYGKPGDLLWCKETWAVPGHGKIPDDVVYRADETGPSSPELTRAEREALRRMAGYVPWRQGMLMPRRVARLWLLITEVRVQYLQQITAEDARAEGVHCPLHAAAGMGHCVGSCRDVVSGFRFVWDRIHTERGNPAWNDNPLVWAISFDVLPASKVPKWCGA